ncbi:MAG TPA: SxtJ family membrane protein [Longimicrobiales bacterium]|nr:SxtJ family membrane protein [Longimicrobiales bacterium]
METRVRARLTAAEGRRFGLTVGAAFLALTALLWWRNFDTARWVTGAAAAFFLGGGLLVPARMGPVNRAWMQMALAISKVTTPIFMGIIFFLVITPIGAIARAAGHRPLDPARSSSLWRERPEGDRRSDLHRQF